MTDPTTLRQLAEAELGDALKPHVNHDLIVDTDGETGAPYLLCMDDEHESEPITIYWQALATRDQRIAELEAALGETTRMLAYLWDAEDFNGTAVKDTFYDDDPLNEDVPKCIDAARAALAQPATSEADGE